MKTRINFIAIFSFMLLQNSAFSQLPSLNPGTQIKITVNKYFLAPIVGQIAKISPDSLTFSMGKKIFSLILFNCEKKFHCFT